MLDLDSLMAFVRACLYELQWIREKEEIELNRDWSDITQLDLPALESYQQVKKNEFFSNLFQIFFLFFLNKKVNFLFQQLLKEIEEHKFHISAIYEEGNSLLEEGHPAQKTIETYLNTLKTRWEWLVSLATECSPQHLADAHNTREVIN